METGLQHRLRRARRQIAAQHRHLRPIYAVLDDAIARSARDEATGAFDRYRTAIHAHFSLEDELFFPALHGLRPEHTPELNQLSGEHGLLLSDLDQVRLSLTAGDLSPAVAALRAFLGALEDHEQREERLVDTATLGLDDDGA